MFTKDRTSIIQELRDNPELDVLVIGGGVNGIGTYRDLGIQGLRILLTDKVDFASGASAGSSHMLHGGIRYLENGEFRLVREALHERNRMLINAPHYSKPLPTTIPIFRWFSGMFNAPLKFVRLIERPSERGAIVIKLGLIMYDWFTGKNQTMPYHKFRLKDASLKKFPKLSPDVQCTATYYDAWMPTPERICIDMLVDTALANPQAYALNYMPVTGGGGGEVILTDSLTGESLSVRPKTVINAAGPWIDFVNEAMNSPSHFIGGTKGSHIVVDHPELLEATDGCEIFFENSDGRIVLVLPFLNRVMIGTTDIRIENPDEAVCTEDEVDYMLRLVKRVFPSIEVNRSHIVFRFSGVRPLPYSEDKLTGTISRDHSIRTVGTEAGLGYPVHSLVGGKWTTFRAFSEQAADVALRDLGKARTLSTADLPIGGGKDFPMTDEARKKWLNESQKQVELPVEQLEILLDRYGTRAREIAKYMSEGNDAPLTHKPDYTRREVEYIARKESVLHLDDFLLRRSLIAMLGYTSTEPALIDELAQVIGGAVGWSPEQIRSEAERVRELYRLRHGIEVDVAESV